jgi:hypothetical protein
VEVLFVRVLTNTRTVKCAKNGQISLYWDKPQRYRLLIFWWYLFHQTAQENFNFSMLMNDSTIGIDHLPIEIMEMISLYLPVRDYHRLRVSSRLCPLPCRQLISFSIYKQEMSYKKGDYSEYLKLPTDRINDSYFGFAVRTEQWGLVREWLEFHTKFSDKIILDTFSLGLYNIVPMDIVHRLYDTKRIPSDANDNMPIQVFSSLGSHERVAFLLQDERVDPSAKANTSIIYACGHGHVQVVRLLLLHVDPGVMNNQALQSACERGHLDVVRTLLEDGRVDATEVNHWALRLAVTYNHPDIVRLLLEDTEADPRVLGNQCIRLACEKGYEHVVSILLDDSRVDPTANRNESLIQACKQGHYQVVKQLLQDPRVDPTDRNHEALRLCFEHGHTDIALLFVRDFRSHTFKSIMKSLNNFTF